jgi:hypothetical protein
MIYETGGPSGPATRTGLGITFGQRHRQVLILEAEPNAAGAPRRIKKMDLDGGNLQTLFEINNQTTVIGGFVGWAGPVGTINYCEKTDRVFFIASQSSTAEFRRLCSVNYQNLDLQFHASGSKAFGLIAPGFRMGCGFEATGGTYTG